jgi:hypothetical protein
MVRWHRKGFAAYWRWKSRSPGGRPRIAREVREKLGSTRALSVQNGQLMLKNDKLELERGAAAKAKGDDRNNGKKNRHHDP